MEPTSSCLLTWMGRRGAPADNPKLGKIMRPSAISIKAMIRVLGLDVAKATVVLFDPVSGRTFTIANEPDALLEALKPFADYELLVCEATGGHERAALDAAATLGLAAHRADAAKVKNYIRSHGGAAKSDPIDARWLSRYGQERGPGLARWTPPDPDREAFASLVRHRQDLVAQRTQTKNRLAAPGPEPLRRLLKTQLAFLDSQLAEIDQTLKALVKANRSLAAAEARLRAIPGIGPVCAGALLALMPELGSLNRKQAASLAGLAPHPNESGQTFGRRRMGRSGRAGLRPVLFMAALSAARAHPDLKAFAERLIQAGKPKRLVFAAVARKLLVIANAVCKAPATQLT